MVSGTFGYRNLGTVPLYFFSHQLFFPVQSLNVHTFVSVTQRMASALGALFQWFTQNQMEANCSKTQLIVFGTHLACLCAKLAYVIIFKYIWITHAIPFCSCLAFYINRITEGKCSRNDEYVGVYLV